MAGGTTQAPTTFSVDCWTGARAKATTTTASFLRNDGLAFTATTEADVREMWRLGCDEAAIAHRIDHARW